MATVLEFRGKVFSGGGDKDEYTLANFLRTYDNGLQGSPSGVTLPLGKRIFVSTLSILPFIVGEVQSHVHWPHHRCTPILLTNRLVSTSY